MSESLRAFLVGLKVIGALGVLAAAFAQASADHQPSNALVTITDNPDPAASGGNIVYTVAGKNDGSVQALDATVEAEIPATATFVTCRTNPVVPCSISGAIVTALFPTVKAHASARLIVTVKAPDVTVETLLTLRGKFSGQNMHMDERLHTTTVLPVATRLLMHPSLRIVTISCGATADAALFGDDTEAEVLDGLVCDNGSGVTFTASGKTLNLGGKRFVSASRVTGNAGIVVGPNATNVTIDGAGTQGTKGIEHFDYCVKDLGGNTGLLVTGLRCFRAKTAAISTVSNDVIIENSLVDNTIADEDIEVPPGGIGIDAAGDNIRVKDTIVRRSGTIGFWAHGTDVDGSGSAATYDGNTTTSRIESNFGIGVLLSGGPHRIKGTQVRGDDHEVGTSTDGIVVAADAMGAVIEEVVVKKHRGNGIRVDAGANGTVVERVTVEEIGGNGYVIGAPSTLNGNSAKTVFGSAFLISASAMLTSNRAEEISGDAFVINAAAIVDSNVAVDNSGYGFVVTNSNLSDTVVDGVIEGVGDFNGDGAADILLRNTSGRVTIWLMDGTGIVSSGSPATVGAEWSISGVGDFDGDGKADILWRHVSGTPYIWLMVGTGIVGTGFPASVGAEWSISGVGDFDGDGKADILWRHVSGTPYIWLMAGTGIVGAGFPASVGTEWSISGVGDFDGDGKADILWRHVSGTPYIWLMAGTGIVGTGTPGGMASESSVGGVADFDGDGKADILWRHSTGAPEIWIMNGTDAAASGFPPNMATDWSIQGLGDFNDDGMADIIWRHSSGLMSTWFMRGTSLLTASGPARLLSNSAEGNALGGFQVSGSGNVLIGNDAKSSGGTGFSIDASGNVLNTNAAERSGGPEFVIGPDNVDDDGNRANGAVFSFTEIGGVFE